MTHADAGGRLQELLRVVSDGCTRCDLCQSECAFLKKYGKPKEIADRYDPSDKGCQTLPFECSLCSLCAAVCPVGVDPSSLFLEMRREAVRRGGGNFPEHAGLKSYERRGVSRTFSYYGLPEGCETVFFPGCALSGTRSEKVILVYERLKERNKSVGIVLDCCMKPSHDLGDEAHFREMFEEMREYLVSQGVREVLVACPNCYRIFSRYGAGLSTKSIYECLAGDGKALKSGDAGEVTVHDPCAVRFEAPVQDAVRTLLGDQGFRVTEMDHSGARTLCCGEGGAVACLVPQFAMRWGRLRREEALGRKVVTYCAGCAGSLARLIPSAHVLDVLFDPVEAAGKARVSKPPFTYWKRLRLKKWCKKHVPAALSRERTFAGREASGKGAMGRFLLFLFFVVAVIAAVKVTGASRYLEPQTLRTWVQGCGILAPAVYICVYAVAPALFLPGLPITIAGGILFGPFWGVVYAIIGSTLGACLAFLVSRYLAREWVEERLRSPRWRSLDEGVQKHGWKIVAFTRLIPLFPFNLLNYAFGLTRIGFREYAVATFLCMLPGCIAFIVFSSSILDLIRGKVSLTFVIGLALVALVSMFPLIYRRYKAKRGEDDPV
jgi:uncharacterized membrane protein YdjX (TVP38/TMEM64 family)/Fe-S oxidoreductase